jgi:hypothetical protein
MKKIILLYFISLLVFFAMGAIAALMKYYAWWYVFLFIIPVAVGTYSLTEVAKTMVKYINGCCALFFISFIISITLLLLGFKIVDADSFLGIIYACGFFGSTIVTAVLMLKLRNCMIYGA